MPWTVADVESHKKGLTPKQKKQWVAVANSVLSRCQSAGGSDCEGKAVRQANGVVGKALELPDVRLVLEARITKTEDSRRRLFGWASIAVQKDGTPLLDLQGDLIDIEDLEEAFYDYVLESGELNFAHHGECRGALIEAIVFTPDKLAALGLAPDALPLGAWVGYQVDDIADYQLMKDRGYMMFSIEGSAVREAV